MSAPARLARFADGERIFHALLEGDDRAREIRGDPFQNPPRDPARIGAGPLEPGALDAAVLRTGAGPSRPIAGLRWLAPCLPSKIVGVGRNYREHAVELGHAVPPEPLLFLKPTPSVLPHLGVIRLPEESGRVDYEGELAAVIGRTVGAVPEDRALDHVLGSTCLNDVTARDLQASDVQFTRAKGFDTFCPVEPCVAIGLDPSSVVVEKFVNGALGQSAPASGMIFGVARLVSFVSRIMTLFPGDLIATGTPEGVGPLRPGDEVTVAIAGIGRLTNRVQRL